MIRSTKILQSQPMRTRQKSRCRHIQVRSTLVRNRLVPAATEARLGTNQRARCTTVHPYQRCDAPQGRSTAFQGCMTCQLPSTTHLSSFIATCDSFRQLKEPRGNPLCESRATSFPTISSPHCHPPTSFRRKILSVARQTRAQRADPMPKRCLDARKDIHAG